ncbi:MAG: RHS repeat-associated core domain-containing protein [Acidobacteria bacterium]|nr:RHS repeat-associated core domain-containing protein [Acidobacteriota bacterium]
MAGVFFLTQSADGGPETGESIDVELGAPGGGDPGPDPGGPGPPDPAARQFTSLYQHRDHLGTIRVVTRATGAVERALDFYPFGTLLGASGAGTAGEPRHQFTGHERDEATGLDSMQARFHDSTLASFLSVDPGPARPASPQSWNRYAYVLNNPLTLVDPSGMVPRAAGSGGARSSYVRVPGYRADGTGAVGSMMEGFGLPQDVQDPHEKPATAAEPQVDVNSPSSELRGEIAQAAARQGAVEPICATPADLSVGPLTPDLASLQNAVFNLMSDPAAQTTEVFVELGKDAQGTWQPLSSGTLTPTGGNIDLVTGPEYSAYAVIHNHLGNGCPTSQKDVDTAKSFERFVAPAPVLSLVVYEQGVVRYDGSAEAWRVEGMRWR